MMALCYSEIALALLVITASSGARAILRTAHNLLICDFALVLSNPGLGQSFRSEAGYGGEALSWDADLGAERHIGSANDTISRVSVGMGHVGYMGAVEETPIGREFYAMPVLIPRPEACRL